MKDKEYFIEKDYDDENVRHEFIEFLKENGKTFFPYRKTNFNDWMIFDGALNPAGVDVAFISGNYVYFAATCAGVQEEGLCCDAQFMMPRSKFTPEQIGEMAKTMHFHPTTRQLLLFMDPMRINGVEWYYDEAHDERVSDGWTDDDAAKIEKLLDEEEGE